MKAPSLISPASCASTAAIPHASATTAATMTPIPIRPATRFMGVPPSGFMGVRARSDPAA